MRISETLVIEESELDERYQRASGPGGQHVNKTESAVQLRFDVRANQTLPQAVKARLVRLAGSRMTKDGVLILQADTHRARERNRMAVRERLRALIERALIAPKPRKKSRPSLASVKRVKENKARRSSRKALRRKPGTDSD